MENQHSDTEIFDKAQKAIRSCTNLPQLRAAEEMIKNIEKTHGHLVFDLKCEHQMKLQEISGHSKEILDFDVTFETVSPNEKG